MEPLKQTPKTSAEAEADRNTLLTALFKRVRHGRPKVIANLAGDVIVVASEKYQARPCSKSQASSHAQTSGNVNVNDISSKSKENEITKN